MSNSYRIESQQKATVNGAKGRIITLYNGNVHDGKYFIPARIRSNQAAIEYALEQRAEQNEQDFRSLQ